MLHRTRVFNGVSYDKDRFDDDGLGEFPNNSQILIGVINGSNNIFKSPDRFDVKNVSVFVNGIKQNIITDYQISNNNTIIFTFSPNVGETLVINY